MIMLYVRVFKEQFYKRYKSFYKQMYIVHTLYRTAIGKAPTKVP